MKKSVWIGVIVGIIIILLIIFLYPKFIYYYNGIYSLLNKCNSVNDTISPDSLCIPKGMAALFGCEQKQRQSLIHNCEILASEVRAGHLSSDICYKIKFPLVTAYCLPSSDCLKYVKNNSELRRICYYNACMTQSNYCTNEYNYGLSVDDCSLKNSSYSSVYDYFTCLNYHKGDIKQKAYLCEEIDPIEGFDINKISSNCKGRVAALSGDDSYCKINGVYNLDCVSTFSSILFNTLQFNENETSRAILWDSFCEHYFISQDEKMALCKKIKSSFEFHELFIGCVDTDGGKNYYLKPEFLSL